MGRSVCEHFAALGHRVAVLDIDEDRAEQVVDELRGAGGEALACSADVADRATVDAALESVRRALGPVEILVTSAGISGFEDFTAISSESWHRILEVNLTGTFLCTKHAARLMVERKTRGSIIVIVSTAGHQGQAGNIGYCTSKSGLLNFTRAAAMDLARHGIRVNSLTPTATDAEEGLERAEEWGRTRPERRGRRCASSPCG